MRNAIFLSMLLAAAGACAGEPDAGPQPIPGRDDLFIQTRTATIRNGLSQELTIEAPSDVKSVLMEVRGKKGKYFLTKFVTPRGELIESAQYTTRFAREIPGLVDWLYPNAPHLVVEPGEYKILLRGETESGGPLNEDVEVRFYAKMQSEIETCGFKLDFLVDEKAIDARDIEEGLKRSVTWAQNFYARYGVRIIDYQITNITLPNPHFDPTKAMVNDQVDDVLRQARAIKGDVADDGRGARNDSVHVIVVDTIGGSEPSGYSMGLPGPYDADRANAAVLLSTGAYTGPDGLDPEGLGSTLSHEIGHFMGLYHTSEASRTSHDPLPDTPQCTDDDCPPEYRKNIMSSGGGATRDTLSPGQAFVVKNHPLCIPTEFEEVETTCELACVEPKLCSLLNGNRACRQACDPDAEEPCPSGKTCKADDLGTYVCQ